MSFEDPNANSIDLCVIPHWFRRMSREMTTAMVLKMMGLASSLALLSMAAEVSPVKLVRALGRSYRGIQVSRLRTAEWHSPVPLALRVLYDLANCDSPQQTEGIYPVSNSKRSSF